jgi:hypothetical protein
MEFEESAVTRMLAAHAGSGELEALSSALLEAEAPAILSREARP